MGESCGAEYSPVLPRVMRDHAAHSPLSPPFPFHCWSVINLPSLCNTAFCGGFLGLSALLFPFHCWLVIPVSLSGMLSPPVSLLDIPHVPAPWALIMLNITDSCDVRTAPRLIFPERRTGPSCRLRNTSRINPDPRRNTIGTSNKPATESTCAQGIHFIEELLFSGQNCKSHHFSLSCRKADYPGNSPRVEQF